AADIRSAARFRKLGVRSFFRASPSTSMRQASTPPAASSACGSRPQGPLAYGRRRSPSRHIGMEISDARKLKALEDENRRLKKLLAESMLDASTLKEMLGKNF